MDVFKFSGDDGRVFTIEANSLEEAKKKFGPLVESDDTAINLERIVANRKKPSDPGYADETLELARKAEKIKQLTGEDAGSLAYQAIGHKSWEDFIASTKKYDDAMLKAGNKRTFQFLAQEEAKKAAEAERKKAMSEGRTQSIMIPDKKNPGQVKQVWIKPSTMKPSAKPTAMAVERATVEKWKKIDPSTFLLSTEAQSKVNTFVNEMIRTGVDLDRVKIAQKAQEYFQNEHSGWNPHELSKVIKYAIAKREKAVETGAWRSGTAGYAAATKLTRDARAAVERLQKSQGTFDKGVTLQDLVPTWKAEKESFQAIPEALAGIAMLRKPVHKFVTEKLKWNPTQGTADVIEAGAGVAAAFYTPSGVLKKVGSAVLGTKAAKTLIAGAKASKVGLGATMFVDDAAVMGAKIATKWAGTKGAQTAYVIGQGAKIAGEVLRSKPGAIGATARATKKVVENTKEAAHFMSQAVFNIGSPAVIDAANSAGISWALNYQSSSPKGTQDKYLPQLIENVKAAAANGWLTQYQMDALDGLDSDNPEERKRAAERISKAEIAKSGIFMSDQFMKAMASGNPLDYAADLPNVMASAIVQNFTLQGNIMSKQAGAYALGGSLAGKMAVMIPAASAYIGSHSLEVASAVLNAYAAAGVDIRDHKALLKAIENKEIRAKAVKEGNLKGIMVGAFDAVSAIIGGKFLEAEMYRTVNGVRVLRTDTNIAKLFAKGAADFSLQAAAGMFGELTGQLNRQDGGAFNAGNWKNLSWGDIMAEGAIEGPSGIIEVVGGIRSSNTGQRTDFMNQAKNYTTAEKTSVLQDIYMGKAMNPAHNTNEDLRQRQAIVEAALMEEQQNDTKKAAFDTGKGTEVIDLVDASGELSDSGLRAYEKSIADQYNPDNMSFEDRVNAYASARVREKIDGHNVNLAAWMTRLRDSFTPEQIKQLRLDDDTDDGFEKAIDGVIDEHVRESAEESLNNLIGITDFNDPEKLSEYLADEDDTVNGTSVSSLGDADLIRLDQELRRKWDAFINDQAAGSVDEAASTFIGLLHTKNVMNSRNIPSDEIPTDRAFTLSGRRKQEYLMNAYGPDATDNTTGQKGKMERSPTGIYFVVDGKTDEGIRITDANADNFSNDGFRAKAREIAMSDKVTFNMTPGAEEYASKNNLVDGGEYYIAATDDGRVVAMAEDGSGVELDMWNVNMFNPVVKQEAKNRDTRYTKETGHQIYDAKQGKWISGDRLPASSIDSEHIADAGSDWISSHSTIEGEATTIIDDDGNIYKPFGGGVWANPENERAPALFVDNTGEVTRYKSKQDAYDAVYKLITNTNQNSATMTDDTPSPQDVTEDSIADITDEPEPYDENTDLFGDPLPELITDVDEENLLLSRDFVGDDFDMMMKMPIDIAIKWVKGIKIYKDRFDNFRDEYDQLRYADAGYELIEEYTGKPFLHLFDTSKYATTEAMLSALGGWYEGNGDTTPAIEPDMDVSGIKGALHGYSAEAIGDRNPEDTLGGNSDLVILIHVRKGGRNLRTDYIWRSSDGSDYSVLKVSPKSSVVFSKLQDAIDYSVKSQKLYKGETITWGFQPGAATEEERVVAENANYKQAPTPTPAPAPSPAPKPEEKPAPEPAPEAVVDTTPTDRGWKVDYRWMRVDDATGTPITKYNGKYPEHFLQHLLSIADIVEALPSYPALKRVAAQYVKRTHPETDSYRQRTLDHFENNPFAVLEYYKSVANSKSQAYIKMKSLSLQLTREAGLPVYVPKSIYRDAAGIDFDKVATDFDAQFEATPEPITEADIIPAEFQLPELPELTGDSDDVIEGGRRRAMFVDMITEDYNGMMAEGDVDGAIEFAEDAVESLLTITNATDWIDMMSSDDDITEMRFESANTSRLKQIMAEAKRRREAQYNDTTDGSTGTERGGRADNPYKRIRSARAAKVQGAGTRPSIPERPDAAGGTDQPVSGAGQRPKPPVGNNTDGNGRSGRDLGTPQEVVDRSKEKRADPRVDTPAPIPTPQDSGLGAGSVSHDEQPTDEEAKGLIDNQHDVIDKAISDADKRTVAEEQPTAEKHPLYNATHEHEDDLLNGDHMRNVEQCVSIVRKAAVGDEVTDEDRAILAQFPGWGWLKSAALLGAINSPNAATREMAAWVQGLGLTDIELDGVARASYSSFFTPTPVIQGIWAALETVVHTGINKVLEPSAGSGLFLTASGVYDALENAKISVSEVDPFTLKVLQLLMPSDARIGGAGFENMNVPRGSQDVVISNVPFGDTGVVDAAMSREFGSWSTSRIHNYFIMKSILSARQGGIVALITSRYTLDSTDKNGKEIREFMAKQGRVLSVVRMPSGTFNNAGTEVIADVIIFQRTEYHPDRYEADLFNGDESHWSKQLTNKGQKFDVKISSLVDETRVIGNMIGSSNQFGNAMSIIPPAGGAVVIGGELQRMIEMDFRHFADVDGMYQMGGGNPMADIDAAAIRKLHGDMAIDMAGTVTVSRNGEPVVVDLYDSGTKKPYAEATVTLRKEIIRAYIPLRDAYMEFYNAFRDKTSEPAEVKALADKAIKAYEVFRKKVPGPDAISSLRITLGRDSSFAIVQAMEKQVNKRSGAKTYKKITTGLSEIVTNPLGALKKSAPKSTFDTVEAAYTASLNEKGMVDVAFMANSMNGQTPESVTELLKEKGLVVANIYGAFSSDKRMFVTPDELRSDGNIRSKLMHGEKLLEQIIAGEEDSVLKNMRDAGITDEDIKKSVDMLVEAVPPMVPFSQIGIECGASWIPEHIYTEFLSDGANIDAPGVVLSLKAVKVPGKADWVVEIDASSLRKLSNVYWIPAGEEKAVLEAVLTSGATIKPSSTEDNADVLAAYHSANIKIGLIRARFPSYVANSTSRSAEVHQEYNRRFNVFVQRHFDGSFLTFPDQVRSINGTDFSLKPHQKNAVWRIVNRRSSLLSHEVGTGKTYSMVAAAYEMKRMGIRNKPVIFCVPANMASIAADYRKIYPMANILVQNEIGANDDEFLAIASAGDYDTVIAKYTLIPKIGYSPEFIEHYKTTMQKEYVAYLRDKLGVGQSVIDAFFLASKELAYAARLVDKKKNYRPEGMSLDTAKMIYNHALSSKNDAIKDIVAAITGVSDTATSQSARQSVADAMNGLLNIDKRIADMEYEASESPSTMEDLGFDHVFVDEAHWGKNIDFISVNPAVIPKPSERARDLMMLSSYLEQNNFGLTFATGTPISNDIVEMYAIWKYLMPETLAEMGIDNVDDWIGLFATTETTLETSPTGQRVPRTRIARYINVDEMMKIYLQVADIINSDEALSGMLPSSVDQNGNKFYNPDGTEKNGRIVVNCPLTRTLQDMLERWKNVAVESITREGITKTFTENGEEKTNNISLLETITAMRMMTLDPRLRDRDAADEPNSKINVCAKQVGQVYNDPNTTFDVTDENGDVIHVKGAQVIFLDFGYPNSDPDAVIAGGIPYHKGFNLAQDLIDKLVKQGIPRNEIKLVAGQETPEQLEKTVYSNVRNGTTRVIIGSRAKLGIGVNIQTMLAAAHHLSPSWRPDEIEQADGRIQRQGNLFKDRGIKIFHYVVPNSYDTQMWEVLNRKARSMKAVVRGEAAGRSYEVDNTDDTSQNISDVMGFTYGRRWGMDFSKQAYRMDNMGQQYILSMETRQHARDHMDDYRRESVFGKQRLDVVETLQGVATPVGSPFYEIDAEGKTVRTLEGYAKGADVEDNLDKNARSKKNKTARTFKYRGLYVTVNRIETDTLQGYSHQLTISLEPITEAGNYGNLRTKDSSPSFMRAGTPNFQGHTPVFRGDKQIGIAGEFSIVSTPDADTTFISFPVIGSKDNTYSNSERSYSVEQMKRAVDNALHSSFHAKAEEFAMAAQSRYTDALESKDTPFDGTKIVKLANEMLGSAVYDLDPRNGSGTRNITWQQEASGLSIQDADDLCKIINYHLPSYTAPGENVEPVYLVLAIKEPLATGGYAVQLVRYDQQDEGMSYKVVATVDQRMIDKSYEANKKVMEQRKEAVDEGGETTITYATTDAVGDGEDDALVMGFVAPSERKTSMPKSYVGMEGEIDSFIDAVTDMVEDPITFDMRSRASYFFNNRYPAGTVHNMEHGGTREIIQSYGEWVRVARLAGNTLGTYTPSTEDIKIKSASDLGTFTHELAHKLDFELKLSDAVCRLMNKPSELDPKTNKKYPNYLVKLAREKGQSRGGNIKVETMEGLAEAFRLYAASGAAGLQAESPEVYSAMFEQGGLPEAIRDKCESFHQDIMALFALDAMSSISSNIAHVSIEDREKFLTDTRSALRDFWYGTSLKFQGSFMMSAADRFEWAWIDKWHPVIKAYQTAIKRRRYNKDLATAKETELEMHITAVHGLDGMMEEAAFGKGIRDQAGVYTSLRDVNKPIMRSKASEYRRLLLELQSYMVAQREIEEVYIRVKDIVQTVRQMAKEAAALDKEQDLDYYDSYAVFDQVTMEDPDYDQLRMLLEPIILAGTDEGNINALINSINIPLPINSGDRLAALQEVLLERFENLKNIVIDGTGGSNHKPGETDYNNAVTAERDIKNNIDPKDLADIEQAASAYRRMAKAVLWHAYETGMMDKKTYIYLREKRSKYVDMHRVMDEIGTEDLQTPNTASMSSTKTGTEFYIKPFKGSDRMVKDPLVSLAEQANNVIRQGALNQIRTVFTKAFLPTAEEAYFGDVASIVAEIKPPIVPDAQGNYRPSKMDRDGMKAQRIYSVYIGGKQRFFQVTEQLLYDTLVGVRDNMADKHIAWFVNAFRELVTRSPGFNFRNFFKDRIAIPRKTTNIITPWDYIKLWTVLFPNKRRVADYKEYGGGGNVYQKHSAVGIKDLQLEQIVENWHQNKLPKMIVVSLADWIGIGGILRGQGVFNGIPLVTQSWKMMGKMSEAIEQAPKILEWELGRKKYLSQGKSVDLASKLAMIESRRIQDFSRTGALVSKANSYFGPFIAGRISGSMAELRGLVRNPVQYITALALLGALQLANQWWWWKDEERRKVYRQIPEVQKDMFYFFPNPLDMDTFITIPTGHVEAQVSGLLGKVMRYQDDPTVWEGAAGSWFQNASIVSPDQLVGPLRPWIAAGFNRDPFRQRNIVPDFEVQLPLYKDIAGKRYLVRERAMTASNLSWQISKRMPLKLAMDPRKMDYLITNTLGAGGRFILIASDVGRTKDLNQLVRDQRMTERNPDYESTLVPGEQVEPRQSLASVAFSTSGAVQNVPMWYSKDTAAVFDLATKNGLNGGSVPKSVSLGLGDVKSRKSVLTEDVARFREQLKRYDTLKDEKQKREARAAIYDRATQLRARLQVYNDTAIPGKKTKVEKLGL